MWLDQHYKLWSLRNDSVFHHRAREDTVSLFKIEMNKVSGYHKKKTKQNSSTKLGCAGIPGYLEYTVYGVELEIPPEWEPVLYI